MDSVDSWWSTEANASDTGVELRAIESGLGTSERSRRQTNLAYFEELRRNNNWSIRGATRSKMVKKVRSDPVLAPRLKNEHASPTGFDSRGENKGDAAVDHEREQRGPKV